MDKNIRLVHHIIFEPDVSPKNVWFASDLDSKLENGGRLTNQENTAALSLLYSLLYSLLGFIELFL